MPKQFKLDFIFQKYEHKTEQQHNGGAARGLGLIKEYGVGGAACSAIGGSGGGAD